MQLMIYQCLQYLSNAVEKLKHCATDIILSNDEDGVARWLNEHYHRD